MNYHLIRGNLPGDKLRGEPHTSQPLTELQRRGSAINYIKPGQTVFIMRKKVDDNIYHIGAHVRTARMRAELTQEQLSESIGVTSQYLSDLERGLVGISISTLVRICLRLNVSSDFLLFGEDSPGSGGNLTLVEKIQRLPESKARIVENGVDLLLEAIEMDPRPAGGSREADDSSE